MFISRSIESRFEKKGDASPSLVRGRFLFWPLLQNVSQKILLIDFLGNLNHFFAYVKEIDQESKEEVFVLLTVIYRGEVPLSIDF